MHVAILASYVLSLNTEFNFVLFKIYFFLPVVEQNPIRKLNFQTVCREVISFYVYYYCYYVFTAIEFSFGGGSLCTSIDKTNIHKGSGPG